MLRASAAIALALLVLTPSAAAFSSAQQELTISYALGNTPTMISAGALFLDGVATTGLVVAGSTGTSFDRVPELRIVDRSAPISLETTHRGATLVVESGALLWTFSAGATSAVATSERYAIALALPQAPVPTEGGTSPPAGFLLASEAITGTAGWTRGEAALVPLDAVVTINDARGQPLPGWDSKRVNGGATTNSDPDALQYGFVATGAFTARIASTVFGGATGGAQSLRLVLGPAEEDRFEQTAAAFEEASAGLFGPDSPVGGEDNPLDVFAGVSGILNGALLLVPGIAGGEGPAPVLLESSFGGEEFPLGPFNLIRGDDMELEWSASSMTLTGTPTVALGRDGFGVEEPASVGIFPILSLVLWAIAIGAIIFYFVKRPPKAKGPVTLRLASLAFYLVVLVVVFVLWDRSFAQSFGTSALGAMREGGLAGDNLPRVGILLALELVPWSIAALLFALPVRIAAGVGLRYLGRGKSFKGVATGAGLVSLAILGPIYALWCFNLVWSRVAASMPGMGG